MNKKGEIEEFNGKSIKLVVGHKVGNQTIFNMYIGDNNVPVELDDRALAHLYVQATNFLEELDLLGDLYADNFEKRKDKIITLRVTKTYYKELRDKAKKKGVTMSDLILNKK